MGILFPQSDISPAMPSIRVAQTLAFLYMKNNLQLDYGCDKYYYKSIKTEINKNFLLGR